MNRMLNEEQSILNREQIANVGNNLVNIIKERLVNLSIDDKSTNVYITEISGLPYFIANIENNIASYVLYIDQVVDKQPKVIILNITLEKIVMFNINDIDSIIRYINHNGETNLYHTKIEGEYNYADFVFMRFANISTKHQTYLELFNKYIQNNTIIKTLEERNIALDIITNKNQDQVNPMEINGPTKVSDIIHNASVALSQGNIQGNKPINMNYNQSTINPIMNNIGPGNVNNINQNTQSVLSQEDITMNMVNNPTTISYVPDDNTEFEDMDEACKRIFNEHMSKCSALIPDPNNIDLGVDAIRKAVNDRKEAALKEIEEYKNGIENVGKKTPLSNKRI